MIENLEKTPGPQYREAKKIPNADKPPLMSCPVNKKAPLEVNIRERNFNTTESYRLNPN